MYERREEDMGRPGDASVLRETHRRQSVAPHLVSQYRRRLIIHRSSSTTVRAMHGSIYRPLEGLRSDQPWHNNN